MEKPSTGLRSLLDLVTGVGHASELAGPFELTLAAAPDAPRAAGTAVTAWMAGHVSETMLADARIASSHEHAARTLRGGGARADEA